MRSPRAVVARHLPSGLRRRGRPAVVRLRHTGLRASDLVLVSFPKSGNTWLRFVLAQALLERPVDFDSVRTVWPPLERRRHGPPLLPGGGRLLKSHELPRFVGRTRPKVVYLVRDGRDVALSYHRHLLRRGVAVPPLDEFAVRVARGDAEVYGPWGDHVAAWRDEVRRRPASSVLVRYEDLRRDPVPVLLHLTDHLGLDVGEEALVRALADNTVSRMRAREAGSTFLAGVQATTDTFVGAGRTGGWRTALRPDTVAAFEALAGDQLAALGYETGVEDPAAGPARSTA